MATSEAIPIDNIMPAVAGSKADPWLVRFSDGATSWSTFIAAAALLAMTAIISIEIFSRVVLNEPTSWVTEVAAYLLVAIVFFGLAPAERAGAHIQVELLLNVLTLKRRAQFNVVANWLGLFFLLFCAWQIVVFNFSEYANGTRSWGLLSTLQWIPELAMSAGFGVFVLAMLASGMRGFAPTRLLPQIAAALVLIALVGSLVSLGPVAVIAGTRVEAGAVAVCVAFAILVAVCSGISVAVISLSILVALGLAFEAARGSSFGMVGMVLIVAILALLLTGVRIALALGLVAVFGLYFLLPKPQLSTLAERAWTSVNSFTLTAVPMFVLMSALLLRSGVTTRMFDTLVKWFGRTPGGLAHACAAASALFAAVSGSSIATAATLGQVACPEMIKRGYSAKLTFGITAAGATLGIMIPPSIAMIIYGSTVGAPIDLLFIAGIVPGLILAVLFMAAALVWSLLVPGSAPKGLSYTMKEKITSLVNVWPFVMVIGAVLGSLYAGIATATEAGAMGVVMALVLCMYFQAFSWRMLYEAVVETANTTAFIMLIVLCAAALSWVFDYLRLPQATVDLIKNGHMPAWMVIASIALIYIALGMFVESISMMLMTLPVAFPIVVALGFDPIWFGIFLVVMVETGLITPPVGMVLFVLRGVSGNVPLRDIAIGALPFVGVLLAFVGLMVAFPELIMWLPNKMK